MQKETPESAILREAASALAGSLGRGISPSDCEHRGAPAPAYPSRRPANAGCERGTGVVVSFESSEAFAGTRSGHVERVIKLLYLIVLIVDNVAIFGCVGTVQANRANFSSRTY
jgi:hypothetical protein